MLEADPRFKSEQEVARLPVEELEEIPGKESWRDGSEVDDSSYDHGGYEEVYDDFVQDAPEGGWE